MNICYLHFRSSAAKKTHKKPALPYTCTKATTIDTNYIKLNIYYYNICTPNLVNKYDLIGMVVLKQVTLKNKV